MKKIHQVECEIEPLLSLHHQGRKRQRHLVVGEVESMRLSRLLLVRIQLEETFFFCHTINACDLQASLCKDKVYRVDKIVKERAELRKRCRRCNRCKEARRRSCVKVHLR